MAHIGGEDNHLSVRRDGCLASFDILRKRKGSGTSREMSPRTRLPLHHCHHRSGCSQICYSQLRLAAGHIGLRSSSTEYFGGKAGVGMPFIASRLPRPRLGMLGRLWIASPGPGIEKITHRSDNVIPSSSFLRAMSIVGLLGKARRPPTPLG